MFVKEHVCLHALFFVPILPSHNTLQLELFFALLIGGDIRYENNKLSELETENYKKEDYHEKKEVPIYCKLNLTLKEAALYSNIGINKLNSLTSDPDCPFVLFIGHKKLIKRKPFEDFINNEFTQSL